MELLNGIEKHLEYVKNFLNLLMLFETDIIIFYLIILMVKILVFDTETTDVPPNMPGKNWEERDEYSKNLLSFRDYKKNNSMWSEYIGSWPSILQLSYILYDTDDKANATIFNKYIDIPQNVKISEGSLAIHNITREKIASAADVNRAKIYDALDTFMADVSKADIVVGHNVQFDRKMIIAELTRVSKEHKIDQIKEMMDDKHFECTMEKTKAVCNLKIRIEYNDKKTGEPKAFYKIKSPKLLESYKHYFGYEPSGKALHDALIDVIVCLRVYCMTLSKPIDICGTNSIITDYIKQISPPGYKCNNEVELITPELIPLVPVSKKKANRTKTSNSSKSSSSKSSSSKSSSSKSTSSKSRSNSKSRSSKSRSSKSRSNSKSRSRSKSPRKRKSKNEMSDFIVDDKKSIW